MNFLALSLRLWSGLDVFQPQCGRRNPNAIALRSTQTQLDHQHVDAYAETALMLAAKMHNTMKKVKAL